MIRRIVRNAAKTAAAIAGLYGVVWICDTTLRDPRFLDGWTLTVGCLAQVLFSVRRKLPLASLGRVTPWMQAHIYTGFFLAATFGLHTQFELPDGVLESALWGLFLILVLSGAIGAYLSRVLPAKLARGGCQVAFEDIPAAQFELARQADDLALGATGAAGSVSISELYSNTLHGFLDGPRNILAHLYRSARAAKRVCDEIDTVKPYLDTSGKETLISLRGLVIEKDRLDDQYAHQMLLKGWLFVHIPATYGMIVLAVVHIAVVYAYAAGVP